MDTLITAISSIASFFYSESELFLGFTAVMTLVTFITYARDKYKAVKNRWRTPEGTLILLAFTGGAIGGALGMLICRHKIRKAKFYLTVYPLALLQCAFIFYVYRSVIFF